MTTSRPEQPRVLRFVGTVLLTLAVASATLAATPPPIPQRDLPPAHRPTTPNGPPHIPAPPAPPGPPLTLERLDTLAISGVTYYDALQTLTGKSPIGTTATADPTPPTHPTGASRRDRFSVRSTATAPTTVNASSDTFQDAEPSVVAVNVNNATYTASTVIKYVDTGERDQFGNIRWVPRNHFATTTDFTSFSRGALPMPQGYTRSGDPLMAVNPYTGGVAPKRIYCTGILFNQGTVNEPSAIGVWRSDNGGLTWQGPTIVASQNGGGYYTDKPAISVSWYSGSLGHVFVTWANLDTNNIGSSSIWVARSTDGGLSFPDRAVVTYDNVHMPSVAVNANNGSVYSVWVNNRVEDIRFAESPHGSFGFPTHEVVAEGQQLRTTAQRNTNLNGGVRAPSIPMIRYNWVTQRLAVTWHAGDANTDIWYAYRPCSASCNYWGWEWAKGINDNGANDQFMPALDFNTSGNMVFTFYDRRNDPNNILYQQFFAYADSTGTRLEANKQIGTLSSDPRNVFIGDYQDVWDHTYPDGESATNSWIGRPAGINPELYLSRIFY